MPMVRDESHMSTSDIPITAYSTVACLMQGYLWIKTSSMYRKLKQFDNSRSALAESEKYLNPLLEKSLSKIFTSSADYSVFETDPHLNLRDVDSVWNSYSPKIRNFVADIMYEVKWLYLFIISVA